MNAAIHSAETRYLVFLRAGVMLHDTFIDRCESVFARDASVAAIAPAVRLQAADASRHLDWIPDAMTLSAVLNDTRSVPPVFAVRRDVCEALGGFDERFEDLAAYEFWLRLTLARHNLAAFDEPLAVREFGPRRTAAAAGDADDRHLALFRAVLEKHAAAIETVMADVLVAREVRFGRLRDAHRDLIARRDADLAELDRLRAEAAHVRAYLSHHGRDGIDWGDLRRTDPISRDWGYERGMPLDRRYIDDFLAAHSSDVRGSVLEVQEDDFTRACGGARVTHSSVLDVDVANTRASILADLRCAPSIASERFDCIILTQTLHVIDDMAAALRECYRILKPGGVLLATVPSASRVCLEYGEHGDFWRATPAGARALFRSAFTPSAISTSEFGNVLANVAFLYGLAASEISNEEFDVQDPYFPALTGIRARKGAAAGRDGARGVVLLYHRVEEQDDVHDLSVPPAMFEAHLAWLRRECHVVPLDVLLETAPESLPERAVAVTFDDGYVDNLTAAAPLLRQYDLPATFFLTTRWLEEDGEYWWDLLERVLLSSTDLPPSLAVDLGGRAETLPTATRDERLVAHRRLHDVMVHATIEQRDALVRAIAGWTGGGSRRVRPMRADEVRELASDSRVTIGAHSVHHLALPDQAGDVVRREIEESCAALTRLVGTRVDLFAYPYGALNRASAGSVRASCRWGLSCDRRMLADSFDAARVPRLEVKRWDVSELAARLRVLFRPPAAARRASTF
jgi:peptidoglycan/xylan/chitin deacetylase (PgdA/CDA1 family)